MFPLFLWKSPEEASIELVKEEKVQNIEKKTF